MVQIHYRPYMYLVVLVIIPVTVISLGLPLHSSLGLAGFTLELGL